MIKTENLLSFIGILILTILWYGIPIVILWNWLMTSIFHLREINFWEACGLRFFISLLITQSVKRK